MSYAARSSRGALVQGNSNPVVLITEWAPTPHEEPQTSNPLRAPPSSHPHNRSKTTGKPLRSSPLAGPAFSNNRSILSLNKSPDVLRASSLPSIVQDPGRPLSARSKSSIGLSRPASMVSMNSLAAQSCSSVNHLSILSPTPSIRSPQTDMRTIKRPPSAMYCPTETINIPDFELGTGSTPQVFCGLASGSSFVGGRSRSRSRASYMSTASVRPSMRPVSVVLEIQAEEAADAETDCTPPQSSATSSHPKTKPKRAVPVDNSWYIANPYSVTPKFSRLGLAGCNVVMPVSAKEHRKRLSRAAPFRSNTSSSTVNTSSPAHTKGNRSAGTSLSTSSTSSFTTSEQNEMRKLGHRDAVSSAASNEQHTTSRTHKSEWPQIPSAHIRSHRQRRTREDLMSLPKTTSSSSSRTSTFSSAASSASSLPLATPSVVSYATTCTSVGESEGTLQQDHYQYQHTTAVSPTESETGLAKRISTLATIKSWRPSQLRQSKQVSFDFGHSFNGSGGKHKALSINSEARSTMTGESAERVQGVVVDFEPLLSSRTNDVVASVDIVVTSLPKSRSESAVQILPSNEKWQRRTGSLRGMWNTLTWRTRL